MKLAPIYIEILKNLHAVAAQWLLLFKTKPMGLSWAIKGETQGLRMNCVGTPRVSNLRAYYIIYGIYCHMCNSVTYPSLRRVLGSTND